MFGYLGKIAYIDLTRGQVDVRPLDPQLARDFIGGSALACRLVYDQIQPDTDPLGPDNPLAFMAGPFVGTASPSSSRYAVCARSPLTGIWGEATSGGSFGVRLRFAGFDGLIITGKAESPTYITIIDGEIGLADASSLMGLGSYETQEQLRSKHGNEISVACIGAAGENLVKTAAIINDAGRAAGRCGLGAVMGSKNLKAVVARGKFRPPLAQEDAFRALAREQVEKVRNSTKLFQQYGTLGYVDIGMYFGDVPAKYFTETVFPAGKVTGKRLRELFNVKFESCYGCIVGCGRKTELKGKYNVLVDGPEYESGIALGPLCGNYDLESVVYANHLCNVNGLDTISVGVTIAFLMYLLDQGLVTAERVGMDLQWGDGEGIARLIDLIARQEGIGALLAKGTAAIAQELGVDPELAATVKGLEMPMHDPRAFEGQALTYVTGIRGACHERGDFFQVDLGLVKVPELDITSGDRFSIKGRAGQVIKLQNLREVDNALTRCVFASLPVTVTAELLSLATGEEWTVEALDRAGERSFTMKRALNCKLGTTREDDRLPGILTRPYDDGACAGFSPNLEESLKEYYTERRWDWETGKPVKEHLAQLGLADL
ncbi:MAG: aldehyde ferredoxin oxidoreductase family protein [Bacillota bacterium]